MIIFDQVSFRFPDAPVPVLDNVSVAIPEGEFALVVGSSGVGKSTLLRCVNGLVPHFSGGSITGLDVHLGEHLLLWSQPHACHTLSLLDVVVVWSRPQHATATSLPGGHAQAGFTAG